MPRIYKTPPITEAVIEFRVGQAISQDTLKNISRRLEKICPFWVEENIVEVELNGSHGRAKSSPFGLRGTSVDLSDVFQLRPNSISLSRLPPYLGWDTLEKNFFSAWGEVVRLSGNIAPSRIGVRYLNRIDIPGVTGPLLPSEYVAGFPDTPAGFPEPTTIQASHLEGVLDRFHCSYMTNVSTVASPLVDHSSLQVDVDVFTQGDLPMKPGLLLDLTRELREAKNYLFEILVTDKAREIFDK